MDLILAIAAAALGYLFGSISFARVIARLVAPQTDLTGTEAPIEGSEQKLRMHGVSATSLRLQLGNRYGCLASVFDMVKIAAPAYALQGFFPDTHLGLIFAATGVIGHNWSAFSKLMGGYGLSAIYGGLLVFDWTGILVNFLVTLAIGLATRKVYPALALGILVVPPWLWYRSQDWTILAYAITFTIAFLIRLYPDFKQYQRIQEQDRQKAEEAARDSKLPNDRNN